MSFYARMHNNQTTKHQEKGKHRLNSYNTIDEYYYYYYYYFLSLKSTVVKISHFFVDRGSILVNFDVILTCV